ncbi:MAG: hypothetical protein IT200_12180 [Thermoleophilia bacterium]|nr:hypothetical protein [Thermoleophilia bacterium]
MNRIVLIVIPPVPLSWTPRTLACGDASRLLQTCWTAGGAERRPELAREVRRRQPRDAGDLGDLERVGVPRVDEVLRAQQVPGRRDDGHGRSFAVPPGEGDLR